MLKLEDRGLALKALEDEVSTIQDTIEAISLGSDDVPKITFISSLLEP